MDIDEDIERVLNRINWKDIFGDEISELDRRCDALEEGNKESGKSVEKICSDLNYIPPPRDKEEEEDEDTEDVVVVSDNLSFFKFKIPLESHVYVRHDKWIEAVVKEINFINLKEKYKVMVKNQSAWVEVCNIAYHQAPTNKIDVGTRLIAHNNKRQHWASAIVGECPIYKNNKRYLVFFDDGSAQYCSTSHLRLLLEPSDEPVWKQIEDPSIGDFIRDYLDIFPQIPILKSSLGIKLKLFKKNNWVSVKVVEVDSSMMKVVYMNDDDTPTQKHEWVYRGSWKLELMKKEFNEHRKKSLTARFSTAAKTKKNYLIYYLIKDEDDDDDAVEMIDLDPVDAACGSHFKKGNADKQNVIEKIPPKDDFDSTAGHIVNTSVSEALSPIANRIRKKPGNKHTCTPSCLMSPPPDDANTINPLLKPIKHGWERNINQRENGRKKCVCYTSSCGMLLNNLEEVDRCLMYSNSPLTIDHFSFNIHLDIYTEYVVEKRLTELADYSHGAEKVAVECVNSVDNDPPPPLVYCVNRRPVQPFVNINTQPGFLAGCSCTDGCRDRSKCECQQLTVSETERSNEKNARAGYSYRKLKKQLPTGIYECNVNCACDCRCNNRVVQHGLTLKLQVFKTEKKGWGLRCLNDIAAGQFICHYTGQVLNDELANEGGLNNGDEYLADLDYIEVVESKKEGFEREVFFEEAFSIDEEEEQEDDSDKDSSFKPTAPLLDIGKRASRKTNGHKSNVKKKGKKKDVNKKNKVFIINNIKISELDIETLSTSKDTTPSNPTTTNPTTTNPTTTNPTTTNPTTTNPTTTNPTTTNPTTTNSTPTNPKPTIPTQTIPTKTISKPTIPASLSDFHTKKEEEHVKTRSLFGEDKMFTIDTKAVGNLGRYINNSCNPNMFVQNVFVDTHDLRFPWVAFFALRLIKAGSELTWNYGYDVNSVPGKNIKCYCQAPNCSGRLL